MLSEGATQTTSTSDGEKCCSEQFHAGMVNRRAERGSNAARERRKGRNERLEEGLTSDVGSTSI